MASSSTTVASLESIVRSSRGTSGTSPTVLSRSSSNMFHSSSRDTSGTSASGLVFKFSDGDVVLRFGHVPFKHRQFSRRHHHHGLFFGFDQPRQFRPWQDGDFALRDRHELPGHRHSMLGLEGGQAGLHRGPPPEALLNQLEEMGLSTRARAAAQPGSLAIAPVQTAPTSSSRHFGITRGDGGGRSGDSC
jgi:hypothetical protein